ncbi:DUF2252 domain-containing protein [Chloroflexota bacterium]
MSEETNSHTTSSPADNKQLGKALRKQVPRASHGDWEPAPDRPDPISLLMEQDTSRLQHLIPIKYGRMLESPFAFLRGSAVVMASDLSASPTTGIKVVLCGDAHLANFGLFATPERKLVFDINDFDEAYPGPWEWDLKRLAASAVVAGRGIGFNDKDCRDLAVTMTRTYQLAMTRFAQAHTLDVWYYHVDVDDVQKVFEQSSKRGKKRTAKLVKKARTRTHQATMEKLTKLEAGRRRIISDPPLLVPFRDMGLEKNLGEDELRKLTKQSIEDSWNQYLESLPDERRYLLQHYQITDAALRVGGVGSVGTRCIIVLLEGDKEQDTLILQLKESGPSVLESYLGEGSYKSAGQRVVTGQHLIQAASDIFLGWHTTKFTGRDFYWRQLKDMKGSADVAGMDKASLETYLGVCSVCLARAHARTGDEVGIAAYLGKNDRFANAVADFAVAYADQTERDYQALLDAEKLGRIIAERGI